jgi:hypothetical protein
MPTLALILVAGLAGCRHKAPAYVLPHGALVPVDIEIPPDPDPPPLIASLAQEDFGPLSEPPPPPPPKRRPTPAPKEEPPVQIAEAAPAALAIGTLSTGGEAAPQSQQQAQDMIASITRRIAALPSQTYNAQKRQIRQVLNFVDQAKKALGSGDAEGAKNLATKAKLLMDDLEKK